MVRFHLICFRWWSVCSHVCVFLFSLHHHLLLFVLLLLFPLFFHILLTRKRIIATLTYMIADPQKRFCSDETYKLMLLVCLVRSSRVYVSSSSSSSSSTYTLTQKGLPSRFSLKGIVFFFFSLFPKQKNRDGQYDGKNQFTDLQKKNQIFAKQTLQSCMWNDKIHLVYNNKNPQV